MNRRLVTCLALTTLLAIGCGEKSTSPATDNSNDNDTVPAAGTEGGPCYGNGTCNEGLDCQNDICVDTTPDSIVTESEEVAVDDSVVADDLIYDEEFADEYPADNDIITECSSGDVRTISCGMNGNGVLPQECSNGKWVNAGDCADPDVCVNNTKSSKPCGLNGRGARIDICTDGKWEAGSCEDPDVCVDDTTQYVECGLPGYTGTMPQTCDGGQWKTSGECDAVLTKDTWLDEKTGLRWMRDTLKNPPYDCASTIVDGFSGWRLPTITELRTIIRKCPQTEPGGSCMVSYPECTNYSMDCRGCGEFEEHLDKTIFKADWLLKSQKCSGDVELQLRTRSAAILLGSGIDVICVK